VTVYLVGAGPGDPGLLTVRGAELLASAEVVVYDRLSAPELLELTPESCERISVGKHPHGPSTPQREINELLVATGRSGRRTVRLKGGDPFVFARGGEEAEALAAAGVAYEVVPGVSSAIAVPAYAGIPVTRRYSSTSITIVTGHEDPTAGAGVDWRAIARVGGTIVVLMGVGRVGAITAELMAGGLDAGTPAAAIQWGTRPTQRSTRCTLGELAGRPLASPSVIVIGEVAASDLSWFERRPLFGRTVVVTRTRHQASELSSRLRIAGAAVIELPTIDIAAPLDGGAALRAAVARLDRYDWIVLTSPNGVARFCDALRDGRDLGRARIAVIGTGTADALAQRHLVADLVPERFVAESLLEAFPDAPSGAASGTASGARRSGGAVLLARAEVARDVLPEGLSAKGWHVDVVDAYRTVTASPDPAVLAELAGADVITFTSSSTVTRFLEVAGADRLPPIVAAIGPITAGTAREAGIDVAVEAGTHSIPGLVEAIIGHVSTLPPRPAPAPAPSPRPSPSPSPSP